MVYGFVSENTQSRAIKKLYTSLQFEDFQSFCVSRNEFPTFLRKQEFQGISLARQFQEDAYYLCDEVDEAAHKCRLVNTIRKENGRLIGTNTDYPAVLSMFQKKNININDKTVLIIGNGQAAKIMKAVCQNSHAKRVKTIFYKPVFGSITYKEAYTKYADADIIVNTISIGRDLNNEKLPIELSRFHHVSFVLDLIYNPLLTRFLLEAKEKSIPYSNGLYGHILSHCMSAQFMTGQKLEISVDSLVTKHIKEQCNIIFIGMAGSGKTTVGRNIFRETHKKWVDLDRQLVKDIGKTIPKIFEEGGESLFRKYETNIVQEYAKRTNMVISTGGGVITKDINMKHLSQNGILIHLDRPVEYLNRKDSRRPMLQTHSVEELYEKRYPIYIKYADFTIHTKNSLEDAIQQVLNLLKDEHTYDKFK